MNILVIGCGNLGRHLIKALYTLEPHPQVFVIDRQKEAFHELPGVFEGTTIVGDASEIPILEEAGIQQTDILFAVTDNENLNFMLSHIAKEIYQVPKVIAKIANQSKRLLLEDFGITALDPMESAVKNLADNIWN